MPKGAYSQYYNSVEHEGVEQANRPVPVKDCSLCFRKRRNQEYSAYALPQKGPETVSTFLKRIQQGRLEA